ncbi:MAG: hypothetical protein JW866_08165 [Ignavibacteriales bacterium]|nr:hypothetical protein [Ignavibacteriales bacterium]
MSSVRLLRPLLIIIFFFTNFLYSQEKNNHEVRKTFWTPSYTHFSINNVTTWIRNDGESDINPNGNSGLVYPKGSNKTAVFLTGLLYGGKVKGEIRVGGSTYRQGQVPGKILPNGTQQNPDEFSVRIYRVKKNWEFDDMLDEINLGEGTKQKVQNQYAKDWNEWPWKDGAPYQDINSNGIYEPDNDIPGYIGAEQTIWFVCNDLDSNQSKYLYGSRPLGIEMQATIWGYKMLFPFRNCIFRKYMLINKSKNQIDSMHICLWSDPDIGDAGDDFVGCDTTLNLAFAYNAREKDGMYGYTPPAVGYILLQGPLVSGNLNDIGIINNRKIYGKKNIALTAIFSGFKNYIGNFDPPLGVYQGTLYNWNILRGLTVLGNKIINPINNQVTTFCLSGDPVTGEGWIDGVEISAGDRRLYLVSGPITMLPGDTQEVIFAQVLAGGYSDVDNLQAITHLKHNCSLIQNMWNEIDLPLNSFLNIEKTELENKIIFNWSNNSNITHFEEAKSTIFKFQGYNIYQFPSDNFNLNNARRIATYDVVDGLKIISDYDYDLRSLSYEYIPKQFGMDSGIKRYFIFDNDYIQNKYLINGNEYYFGVSAYFSAIEQDKYINQIEGFVNILKCIPKSYDAGTRYSYNFGDVINVQYIQGITDNSVEVIVIDPTKITGDSYEVIFNQDDRGFYWQLIDSTLSHKGLYKSYNFNEGDASPIVDGFQIKLDTITNNFSVNDIYKFRTEGKTYSDELAKRDLDRINIYPNPYYGANPREKSHYETFVTINHLPEYHRVNIKIYNLAGELVKRISKGSDGIQEVRWNLTNESGLPISCGLYLVHIEVPDYGYEKILKVGIIQEQKIPNRY